MASGIVKQVVAGIRLVDSFGRMLKRIGVGSLPGGRLLVDTILWPGDCVKSIQYYRGSFNNAPRLLQPRSFNEKMVHAKLFRRKARYARFADKLAVRNIIEQKVGKEYLSKIYWIGTNLQEARRRELPQRFVIKANHSWGTVILVKDRDTFDWDAVYEPMKCS